MVGTRVERDGDEEPPGWTRSLVRWAVPALGPLLAWVAVELWGVTPWVLFGPTVYLAVVYGPVLGERRRGLHDRVAGTVVVRAERGRARD